MPMPVMIVGIIAFTIIVLTIIGTMQNEFRDMLKRKGRKKEIAQMQADISKLQTVCKELKKIVAEMQEQIAELYIQQYDQKLK